MKLAARLSILLTCVMLLTPVQTTTVYGLTQAGPENLPLFEGDRVIRGENSRDEAYFEIGKGRMAAAGSYLDLYYGHSPTLRPKASTLTLLVDDLPVGSVSLDDTNKEQTLWRVDLSKLALKAGYHKLSLQTHMELNDDGCIDPQNAANWTAVYKNSKISLNLVPSYDKADLTTYPSPFYEKGSSQPLQAIIAVPDGIDQQEFASAARLAQYFSALMPDKRLNFPVYAESELTDALLRDNRVIWMGRSDHWKERGQAAIEAIRKLTGAPANQWQGFIGVAPSPWNSANAQLVVSGNAEQLANAAYILTNETLYSQLQGNLSLIPAEVPKKEASADMKIGTPYTVTLEKMGYSHLTVEGTDQGSIRINYPLPSNWDIDNGAGLKLLFKHSKAIDLNQSAISVKVNGVPVESANLTETSADAGVLQLVLEPGIIGKRRTLEIDVMFQFLNARNTAAKDASNQANGSCANPNYIGNWGVIDKASSLTYVPAPRQTLNLESLPYPFVANDRWNQTALLVPEQAGATELSAALTLAGLIGRSSQNNAELSLVRTSDPGLKEMLKDRNIIYIGTAKSIPDFMNGFPGSLIQFKDDKILSLTNEAPLLSELQSNSAVIQLTPSPLNAAKGLLLLAGTTSEREAAISGALTSATESSKLTGKFVILDNQNRIHAFPLPDEPGTLQSKKPDAGIFFSSGTALHPLLFPIVFLLVLLILIVMIWLARRRR